VGCSARPYRLVLKPAEPFEERAPDSLADETGLALLRGS